MYKIRTATLLKIIKFKDNSTSHVPKYKQKCLIFYIPILMRFVFVGGL